MTRVCNWSLIMLLIPHNYYLDDKITVYKCTERYQTEDSYLVRQITPQIARNETSTAELLSKTNA